MPAERSVDPTWLEVVATQLSRSSTAALEASHELLAHYGDTGEPVTQRAVDAFVDGAAEALGAISSSLAQIALVIRPATEHRSDRLT